MRQPHPMEKQPHRQESGTRKQEIGLGERTGKMRTGKSRGKVGHSLFKRYRFRLQHRPLRGRDGTNTRLLSKEFGDYSVVPAMPVLVSDGMRGDRRQSKRQGPPRLASSRLHCSLTRVVLCKGWDARSSHRRSTRPTLRKRREGWGTPFRCQQDLEH